MVTLPGADVRVALDRVLLTALRLDRMDRVAPPRLHRHRRARARLARCASAGRAARRACPRGCSRARSATSPGSRARWRRRCVDTWRDLVQAQGRAARRVRAARPPSRSGTRCGASPPTRSSRAVEAALAAGDVERAIGTARALIDELPEWHAAQRAYLRALLALGAPSAGLVARMFPPPPASARRPRISVARLLDRSRALRGGSRELPASASPAMPLEIIGVHDARSLAEGYNRAAAQATGDILVFSHDDIELVTRDFARAAPRASRPLRRDRRRRRVEGDGPPMGPRRPAHIHGHILHAPPPSRAGALLMARASSSRSATASACSTASFIAVRRHVWETHRFDADRYDGFHLYDLDFTWRASGAGARLAVPLDLLAPPSLDGPLRRGVAPLRAALRRAGGPRPARAAAHRADCRRDSTRRSRSTLLRAAMLYFRYGAPIGVAEPPR